MTNYLPNRIVAGKFGAGRFDFKRNSEQELDIIDSSGVSVHNIPARDLCPHDAHLVGDSEIEVFIDGDEGWVYVVPGHKTELGPESVDAARKYILKKDFTENHGGQTAVSDGWL